MAASRLDHGTRDLVGYADLPPHPHWPGNARIAVSFVLNYEEGGEHSLLNGDAHSEAFLTEGGATAGGRPARNIGTESGYEYGSHRGFWRILELFKEVGFVFTSWAIGKAVELNPKVVPAMQEAGCEVASHSYRWIDYCDVPESTEKEHIEGAISAITKASMDGKTPPVGWYTGRQSLQTRRLVYDAYREKGLLDKLYDSDAYDEDLPYWVPSPSPSGSKPSPPLLVIPYTLDNNDMKFAQAPGFSTSSSFFEYLKDAFDTLYHEGTPIEQGGKGKPKMMSIGLHCRVVGRPGRFVGLKRFIEYIKNKEDVWVATRGQIAEHWRKTNPPPKHML
ncbi:carbohydrate esterase family 4 protein [Tilletiaria anomala UBC 951]|uniref:Carbohydrate esterase family 4 protein n=1 Tax=Tilletiaria anomala (strain ATCC 24038 / CBS 436.72 / UBC 951) TaxID=1037660 RepID=A0A066VWL3_TILAU|nr:carbohydrate esterase family 4 protein [Tilletiaria anomala UBC 951]KDN44688.1 carbohydrate esterase family 4 protein [Tilletiaria anomala UBC 951]